MTTRRLTIGATMEHPELRVRLEGEAGSWRVWVLVRWTTQQEQGYRARAVWTYCGRVERVEGGEGGWMAYGPDVLACGRTLTRTAGRLAAQVRARVHRQAIEEGC